MRLRLHLVPILLLLGLRATFLFARPVLEAEARSVVQRWLDLTPHPLKAGLGGGIRQIRPVADPDGTLLFHLVSFTGGGFAVIAPDDALEPIVAFSQTGGDALREGSPLLGLLRADLRGRLFRLRASAGAQGHPKWLALAGDPAAARPAALPASSLDDPRVDPLIQSQWDQNWAGGGPCFDYFTPNGDPSGCMATATAQVLRFYRMPSAGVGAKEYSITVDGTGQFLDTRGGDGLGGPYDWDLMPLTLGGTVPDAQRAMIGALLYDTGLALNSNYSSGDTAATFWAPARAMASTFQYASAHWFCTDGTAGMLASTLQTILHPNLDAGWPVVLGIGPSSGEEGHGVVCDGYGYNLGTLYRHLNLGWSGSDDAWYDLPEIGTQFGFDTVYAADFNLNPTTKGEILSGRVLDEAGSPMPGVLVSDGSRTATSNARGIYALTGVPPGACALTATLQGYHFPGLAPQPVVASVDGGTVGDQWALDFQGYTLVRPTITGLVQNLGTPGMTATLQGAGFNGTTQVLFNGTSAPAFTLVSDAALTVTIPDGATTGPVSVTNAAGTATSPAPFLVLPPLTFSPAFGHVGSTLTLQGGGFASATGVAFGAVQATSFTVASDARITVTVPVGAIYGCLTVQRPDGVLVSAARFVVDHSLILSSFSPSAGAAGDQVVLAGGGFTGAIQVAFGTTPAVFTVDQDLQLTATVPPGLPPGPCAVTVSTATASANASPFTVQAVPLQDKPLDLNGDGRVDVRDLAVLLARYGTADPAADLNGDGVVDDADIQVWMDRFQ